MPDWIVSQLGGRENYAIARALHNRKHLACLYTDIWLPPTTFLGRRLRRRYSEDLGTAAIFDFNTRFLARKTLGKFNTVSEDEYYDKLVARSLSHHKVDNGIFFGYSYASRHSLAAAKKLGYKTILGQINPGPAEADLVTKEFQSAFKGKYPPTVPSGDYWDRWRMEVDLSDLIMVNSEWSQKLLQLAGIAANKIVVVPLAYESPPVDTPRQFASLFNDQRPLRLLYLGGVGVRKGFHILIDAMRATSGLPVTLDVVGTLKGPEDLLKDLPSNVTYHGHIPNQQTAAFYLSADVLVFPTLSDGFGLTQLEAQARRLPLITSSQCASVIRHLKNGVVLNEVTAQSILDAIKLLLERPELLQEFSGNSVSMASYSLDKLAENLLDLESHPAFRIKQ